MAIGTVLATPLAVYLGRFAIPIYVSFVVCTGFFVLGGTNATLKRLYANFSFGALYVSAWMLLFVWLSGLSVVPDPRLNTVLALGLPSAMAFSSMSKFLGYGWPFAKELLAVFNGGQMWFAVYIGGATWPLTNDPYLTVLAAGVTVVVAGLIGGLVGVVSIALTLPQRQNSPA